MWGSPLGYGSISRTYEVSLPSRSLPPPPVRAAAALVADLPRALVGPHALPARLDLGRVIAVLGHPRASLESGPGAFPPADRARRGPSRGRAGVLASGRGLPAPPGPRVARDEADLGAQRGPA